MKVIIERVGRIGEIVNIEQGDGGTVNLCGPSRPQAAARVPVAPVAPEPAVGADEALRDLLVSIFDASRLREWLTFRGDAALLQRLPNVQTAPLSLLCFELVALQRRAGGLNEGFFSDLLVAFPGRAHDISRVRERVIAAP